MNIDSSHEASELQVEARIEAKESEVTHWRNRAEQAEVRLRLAMELGRLGTWNWSIPDNQITREGYREELFGLLPAAFLERMKVFWPVFTRMTGHLSSGK